MRTCLGTGKTQPIATQDIFVRVRTQEAFHQHRKPGALQHLLLGQLLAFMLLGFVVVILMDYGTATVMPQLRGGYRRAFQITAEVFHAAPGTSGLFGEVHFPATPVLSMKVAVPPVFVTDMARPGKAPGLMRV